MLKDLPSDDRRLDRRERLLVSALARLGLHVSPSSSINGSGGPSTPARSSSGGADDGQGLRKGSPLSSIRTRLVGQGDTGQSGMQRLVGQPASCFTPSSHCHANAALAMQALLLHQACLRWRTA